MSNEYLLNLPQHRSKSLSNVDCEDSLKTFAATFEPDAYVSFMAKAISALAAAFRLVQVKLDELQLHL